MSLFEMLGAVLIGPLKLLFEVIFSAAYKVLNHPGLAIIALSLVMNIIVLPLYKRADAIQEEARDTENKLKYTVAHIKKTFSGDERMMILQTYYRQNNYNPLSVLSSSVSLLLQIPFFMAAYQFLSGVTAFEGVALGPITDLSVPDGLLVIGGFSVNILPFIMTLVNVVSSALYLKGFPLKTKLQLYGMALFFLVFLYNSPAALVFYWTLNNVFSLAKNLFMRIKNAKRILAILLSVAGVASFITGILLNGFWRSAFMIAVGIAAQLPVLLPAVKKLLPKKSESRNPLKPNTALFALGALFLTVLVGLLIPSTYISASPQEYIDINYFYDPIWYVVYTLCLSAGTFLVWMSVFYWLANDKFKVLFNKLVWILSGAMLVNYMFFGSGLGILSPNLEYSGDFAFPMAEQIINIAVMLLLAGAFLFLYKKFPKVVSSVLLIGSLAITAMSTVNTVRVANVAAETKSRLEATATELPSFNLNKNGKNVVVIMLDRAIGPYAPYIFEELPQLKKQFDGFTYYKNTLSFGGSTIFAAPALYGGYEYMPVEINRRDTELLVDKHNEAIKVMPAIFSEADYDVTMIDPSLAGYDWIPDLTVYDELEDVDTYLADGRFNDMVPLVQAVETRKRNFFFFSLMKTLPVTLQPPLYESGNYRALPYDDATKVSASASFMNAYNVVKNIDTMTTVTDSTENTFMFLRSNITHEPVILQEPDYTPVSSPNNSAYHTGTAKIIRNGEDSKTLGSNQQITHYHVNASALMLLGQWLDYLKENDVYDNTRIIIVSDHGQSQAVFDKDIKDRHYTEFYQPLLLVKDFDAHGFTTAEEFMTNADVPTLAMAQLIENPVNPYTGNPIDSSYKEQNDKYYVTLSDHWNVAENNGYQFIADEWAVVSGIPAIKENWTYLEGETVFPEGYTP